MTDPELTRLWLKITLAFMGSNNKKWQYIDIDDPKASIEMLTGNNDLQDDPYITRFRRVTEPQIDSIINNCSRNGIRILTPSDEDFPIKLRITYDPPSVLFVLGDIKAVEKNAAVAVVGARECCDYSLSVARTFAGQLATRGVNIVSGFANGIDQAAHIGALENGGVTTAFIGCGLLYDYPRGSRRLKRMIAEHGAVMSEYLPNSAPSRDTFKVRNRLMSGFSDCVLVVEAAKRSGTMNTVGHALDQGKDVFVVPSHNLFDPRFEGQSNLLLDGAQLAVSSEQIVEYLMRLYEMI